MKYFLKIELAHSTQEISISQQNYMIDLLVEIGNIRCKPVSTLIQITNWEKLKKNHLFIKGMYKRLVSRLIYLVHTWPDIACSVNVLNQFMHDPREPHLQAMY